MKCKSVYLSSTHKRVHMVNNISPLGLRVISLRLVSNFWAQVVLLLQLSSVHMFLTQLVNYLYTSLLIVGQKIQ